MENIKKIGILVLILSMLVAAGCASKNTEPVETSLPVAIETTVSTEAPTTAPTTVPTTAPTTAPTEPKPTQPEEALGVPENVIENMYRECGNVMLLQLSCADGTQIGPFETRKMAHNLASLWSSFTPCEEQEVSACPEQFTVTGGDGTRSLTVYQTEPLCVRYEKDGEVWWYSDAGNRAPYAITLCKGVISGMERNSFLPVSFADQGRDPLTVYADTAYPARLAELTPGNLDRVKDYTVVSVETEYNYENAVCGEVVYAGIPEGEVNNLSLVMPVPGTGEYECMYLYRLSVFLEKQADGKWHEVSEQVFWDAVQEESVFTRRDDSKILSDPEAKAVLKASGERLAEIRRLDSDYEIVDGTAELFLQVLRAAALCNTEEVDFAAFFTEGAEEKFGIQNMMHFMVYWENAGSGYNRQDTPLFQPYGFYVKETTAVVDCGSVILYFVKDGGIWRITDVSLPWYP